MNRRRPANKPADRTGEHGPRRPLAKREEVAEYLQLPVKTLARWASLGIGPPYQKIGRHTRYRWADVERWLDRQQQRRSPGQE
jgi:excisionase family DNA binding protein